MYDYTNGWRTSRNLTYTVLLTILSLSCISSVPESDSSSSNFSLNASLMSKCHVSEEDTFQMHTRGVLGSSYRYNNFREEPLTKLQLIDGIDILLDSTAQYRAFNFSGVYELKDTTALTIIQSCQQAASSQLSSSAFMLWMQQTQQSLLELGGDECQPLMRRFIVATIVRHWLTVGMQGAAEETQATALMGQVSTSFHLGLSYPLM